MNNTRFAYSTASDLDTPNQTFHRPTRRGWDVDHILPLEVANQLHQAEMRRPPLETMASPENLIAITKNANQRRPRGDFLPPVPSPASSAEKRPSFIALQEWEGVVTSVREEAFTARIVDLTHPTGCPDEEAEFPMSELSDDDFGLVTPGAFFRWSVGITKTPGGSKKPTSLIVFRRLPRWTRRDIQRADAVAREIIDSFEKVERSADK
jgi:hypothetical protein